MAKLFVLCIAIVAVFAYGTVASPISEEAMAVREEQMCPVPPADEYVNRTWTVEYYSSGGTDGKNHRTGRAMGDCNGGQGWYGTRINKDKGEHSKNGQQAKRCLEKAFGGIHWKWGCYRATEGQCKCVLDSCFIFNYDEVFQQGLASFSVETKGFQPNEAERYEYNMYLHYSCDRDNTDIDDEFGL